MRDRLNAPGPIITTGQSQAVVVYLIWVLGLGERPKVSFIGEFSPNFDLKLYDFNQYKGFSMETIFARFF
jgi:hypothetical protein